MTATRTHYYVLTPVPCGPFRTRRRAEEAAVAAIASGRDAQIIDAEEAAALAGRSDLSHVLGRGEPIAYRAADVLVRLVKANPLTIRGAVERDARRGDKVAQAALRDMALDGVS